MASEITEDEFNVQSVRAFLDIVSRWPVGTAGEEDDNADTC